MKSISEKTFHYVAMPHLPVTEEWCACAFTAKIHKLTRMLLDAGHKVCLYGVSHTDIEHENLEFIPVVSMEDVIREYGKGDNRFVLGYDHEKEGFKHDISSGHTETTRKFRAIAIDEINKRKQSDHFLLLSQGLFQKPIAEGVNLFLTCEPGIGYRGSYAEFRAFESSYIQNFTYGSANPFASLDGKFYDRVIPNYFDKDDFIFSDTPDDYLLFVGRIIPRKGVSIAIEVANALGKKLIVAGQGKLEDLGVEIKGDVEHVGVVDVEQRKKLMSKALVSFAPTIYLEPFGGVSIEANLSGTPVLTTNFGVYPETIKNGVNGYRCDTLQDFVDNTKKAFDLPREEVYKEASNYTMENVWPMFDKWFSELYQVYLSTTNSNIKAWSKIDLEGKK